jgi:hypothetical protein
MNSLCMIDNHNQVRAPNTVCTTSELIAAAHRGETA